VGERSRPIHTSCECVPHAKAECATTPRILSRLELTRPPDKEAGQAFERAAEIQTNKLSEPDDAANTLTEAFKVYRKTDPLDAARCLDVAINHYTAKGNFRRAATHKQNLAECYEVEIGDQKKAIESYELAASWFESDNAEAYVHCNVVGWYI
jgi:tetratricopeptide (TPR) repeat protein